MIRSSKSRTNHSRGNSGFLSPETRTDAMESPRKTRSRTGDIRRSSENLEPNMPKPNFSPLAAVSKSASRSKKSTSRALAAPLPAVLDRRFVMGSQKGKKAVDLKYDDGSFRQVPYDSLRTSHEDIFKIEKKNVLRSELKPQPLLGTKYLREKEVEQEQKAKEETNSIRIAGVEEMWNTRGTVLKEARRSIPDEDSGQVMCLVMAFEKLTSTPNTRRGGKGKADAGSQTENSDSKDSPLPSTHMAPRAALSSTPSPACSFREFSFPPKHLKDFGLYSSTLSANWRLSFDTTLNMGKSRRNSSESSSRNWHKKLKVTSQQPFKLRTEQRGRLKEEQFQKKVEKEMMDEEKRLVPVAQGLPWTTDEPEYLLKPTVKEATQPIDVVLHSDVRALERAEFDQYMDMRLALTYKRKLEMERQQKLEEEQIIRKLRKESVPRAHPMPYFDRPFVPTRSTRPITVPKDPRFSVQRSPSPSQ